MVLASPPQQSHLQPGYRLDRYELLYPLAQGGMATVWVARLTGKHGFEKLVAVKTILAQYADDPEFRTMFLDEARLAARIRHPNVAEIMDLGEENETLFLVMEWVDGDSLARLYNAVTKAGQRFPLNVLVRIAADCCAGLHAAHDLVDERGQPLGVVHRDVSPQNILVGMSGVSKVIDFGVAKAAGRLAQETSAGLVKGKIQYASPEQAMGRALDRRSDVFSMGTVLYQVLAGKLPFDGENQLAMLHSLTSGKPPKPLPPQVPPGLQAVVKRALAYKPEERYPTARDMQLALEACMVPAPTPADVAGVMHQFLGDRAEARKREVGEALAVVSSRQQINPEAVPGPRSGRVPAGTGFPPGNTPASYDPRAQGAVPGVPSSGVVSVPGANMPPPPPPAMPMANVETAAKGGLKGKHYAAGAVALLITASVWTGVGVMAVRSKAEAATKAMVPESAEPAKKDEPAAKAPPPPATAEAKADPPKQPDPPAQTEAPKQPDPPKQAEAPKVDAPKADTPGADAPKADAPKAGAAPKGGAAAAAPAGGAAAAPAGGAKKPKGKKGPDDGF